MRIIVNHMHTTLKLCLMDKQAMASEFHLFITQYLLWFTAFWIFNKTHAKRPISVLKQCQYISTQSKRIMKVSVILGRAVHVCRNFHNRIEMENVNNYIISDLSYIERKFHISNWFSSRTVYMSLSLSSLNRIDLLFAP